DTLNHSVNLGWSTTYQNWSFRAFHATSISKDPLVETGRQTEQTTHSTSAGATLDMASRGSWDTSISQTFRFTDIANDVTSWGWQNAYDIPFREKLRLGVGLDLGYDAIDPGTDMMDQRLTARANGTLGDKIGYSLSAGASFREFVDSDASTAISPVVSFNLSYDLLERTRFTAGVNHEASSSYFSDQYTQNTSFQGSVSQGLTERWSVSASGGYRISDYESTVLDTGTQREDSTLFARVAVSARVLNRLSATVSYSFRSNSSDQNDFGFDSNQVGLTVNWSL
ncbi:MAG: outer membrane beta-barrel protein, partial [Verrucomicrobiales bacterium]|nr:outer membrane beta-barrel protein [Verrucomicrobiales bacterium]